jgi:hypothetical protein
VLCALPSASAGRHAGSQDLSTPLDLFVAAAVAGASALALDVGVCPGDETVTALPLPLTPPATTDLQ